MQPPHDHDGVPGELDVRDGSSTAHALQSPASCIGLAVAGTVAFVVVQSLALGIVLLAWRIITGASPGLPGIAEGDDPSMLAALVLTELLMALALLGALALGRAPLVLMGLTVSGTRRSIWAVAPLLLLFAGVPMAATIITEGRFVAPGLGFEVIALILVLAPLVAVAEELWFRGFILHLGGGVARPLMAALSSSVLFGLVHLSSSAPASVVVVNAVTVALVVGVCFACIRIVTGTLVGVIVAHGLIDIVGLLALGGFDLPDAVEPAQATIQIVAAAVVAGIYLRWMLRSRRLVGAPSVITR